MEKDELCLAIYAQEMVHESYTQDQINWQNISFLKSL